MPTEIRHYITPWGSDPFRSWVTGLRDMRGKIAILRRIDRLALDNPGDHALCREGVWELRNGAGPGYRVFFGKAGEAVVLLGGGDKDSQWRDLDRAIEAWQDYKRRSRR